jgi:hypothetical protein
MDPAAQRLIHNLHHPARGTPYQYVAVVTGGGAQAMAMLLGVPGASKAILEVLVPYHQRSLVGFLGREPDQNCSAETSKLMARRAIERARYLAPGQRVAGIGCTASLATDRPKKGDHRAHLSIETDNGSTTWTWVFKKGERDREGEEAVLDAVLLNAMAGTFGVTDRIEENRIKGEEELIIENLPTNDSLAKLYRGEVKRLCAGVDGAFHEDADAPALLLPGSFNPLHEGHLGMAAVAARLAGKPIAFEITIDNVDKPSLIIEEVCRRVRQFTGTFPLWLTRAPTFAEKAPLFPGTTFVVGYDTADRLVQAKYYGNSEKQMAEALESIRHHACRFLVAGRSDQNRERFLTLADVAMPEQFRDLFEAIPESEFRLDLSSTQVRNWMNR